MKNLPASEIWFVTGSQHLYGPGPLKQVAANSRKVAAELNAALPLKLVFKSVLTTPEEIRALCLEATNDPKCAGLVLWMHTFSPSKMWIGGLSVLRKPFLHRQMGYVRRTVIELLKLVKIATPTGLDRRRIFEVTIVKRLYKRRIGTE